MAYIPKTWECGEIISADAMNNLESGVQEALECCGGGTADIGYECTEGVATLFDDDVTTGSSPYSYAFGSVDYHEFFPQNITVTFEGTTYELEREGNYYGWGNHSFSEYPFEIENYESSGSVYSSLYTPSTGTYSLKIEAIDRVVTTTPCFEDAVKSVMAQEESGHPVELFTITQTGQNSWTPSISIGEMLDKIRMGKAIFIGNYGQDLYYCMGQYDPGYGGVGLTFVCTRITSSGVTLRIFKFDSFGGSSYEEKTLTVS